ncbi:hypothetical protein B5G26_15790, partial [Anaerotignum lactatifermentans]
HKINLQTGKFILHQFEGLHKLWDTPKVSATPSTRRNIKDLCDIMHVKIDDVSAATLTVELADLPQQINLFLEMLRPFGIVEIARTGLIAVQKGAASMN